MLSKVCWLDVQCSPDSMLPSMRKNVTIKLIIDIAGFRSFVTLDNISSSMSDAK